MNSPDTSPTLPIDIGKLLQVKCHEKPTAEFWNGFEKELKQRALSHMCRGQEGLRQRLCDALAPYRTLLTLASGTAALAMSVMVLQPFQTASLTTTQPTLAASASAPLEAIEAASASAQTATLQRVESDQTRFIVDTLSAMAMDSAQSFNTIHSLPPVLDATPDRSIYVDNANSARKQTGFTAQTVSQHF